jgi:hypothetical protein
MEEALMARAVGMTMPDTHVSVYKGDVTLTPMKKHLAPDTLALIFGLKNLDPKHWADRQDIKVEQTIAGLPEGALERMRALARAKSGGKVIDVESKKS